MKKTTLQFLGWSGVVLGTILLAIGIWVASEHRALLEQGIETTAVITEVQAKGRPGRQTYQATLHPADHPELTIKQPFSVAQFERYKQGDSVPFLFMPARPDVHYFGSRAEARTLGSSDLWSEIGGGVLLATGLAALWKARPPRPKRRADWV